MKALTIILLIWVLGLQAYYRSHEDRLIEVGEKYQVMFEKHNKLVAIVKGMN